MTSNSLKRPTKMSQLDYLWLNFGDREIATEISNTPSDDKILTEKATTELILNLQDVNKYVAKLGYEDDPTDSTRTRLTAFDKSGNIITPIIYMPKEVHVVDFVKRKVTLVDIDNGFNFPINTLVLVITLSNGKLHFISLDELKGGETDTIHNEVNNGIIKSTIKVDETKDSPVKLKYSNSGLYTNLEVSNEDTGINLIIENGVLKAAMPIGEYNLKVDNMTLAEYYKLATVDPGTLYFITDYSYIFLGNKRYGINLKPGDVPIVSLVYNPDTMTISYRYADSSENQIINLSPANSTEITYQELVTLRNNSELIPGMFYRITDYITTVANNDEARSAGHAFDLIVNALNNNTLSEQAYAIKHEGDTYFENANLSSWKVWYSLDNDTNKYNWADLDNGKGVIYRLIDEWQNDCPYDFKNVLFKRYKIQSIRNDGLSGTYLGWAGANYGWSGTDENVITIPDTTDFVWAYTFSFIKWLNDSLSTKVMIGEPEDASIMSIFSEPVNLGGIAPDKNDPGWFIFQYHHKNNQIKSYSTLTSIGDLTYTTFALNNITIYSYRTYNSSNLTYEYLYMSENKFDTNCVNISIGSGTCNTFGHSNYNIIYGFNCNLNKLGMACSEEVFGDNCNQNIFGYLNGAITFGSECSCNQFIFDNDCFSFGNNCSNNLVRYGCNCNIFVLQDNNITLRGGCNNNRFEFDCRLMDIGIECSNNTFGTKCVNINFESNCSYNTFGENCYNINFGSTTTHNLVGKRCYYITTKSNNQNIIYNDYMLDFKLGPRINFIKFSGNGSESSYLQHYVIEGLLRKSSSYITIPLVSGRNATTYVSYNSMNNVVSWVPADLVTNTEI